MNSTLYHFDIQTGKNKLSFKVAKHSSESIHFMLMRVLAYTIHWVPGLRFEGEVCQGDLPAISLKNLEGEYDLWIEIGNPSVNKIKKALSKSKSVILYGFKNPNNLIDLSKQFNSHTVEAYFLEEKILSIISNTLEKRNAWIFQRDQLKFHLNNTEGIFERC